MTDRRHRLIEARVAVAEMRSRLNSLDQILDRLDEEIRREAAARKESTDAEL
jgi:hypothetical protein